MSQAGIVISNASGAPVRAAFNSALEAVTTKQSGATAPSTTYPFMEWADTANDLLKMRNAANSAWITKGTLSAAYGGLPASSIVYDPGSPAIISATNVQDAIDELAARDPGQLSQFFESTAQTITAGGGLTIAHGLSAAPKMVQLHLSCTGAENGYSIGDKLAVPAGIVPDASSASRNAGVTSDATNIYVRFGTGGSGQLFLAGNKSSGSLVGLTNGNWALFVRAWA